MSVHSQEDEEEEDRYDAWGNQLPNLNNPKPDWKEESTRWKQDYLEEFESPQFQWLPAEFYVNTEGSASIHSAINNLHPQHHAQLYITIASVFEKAVPMFEHALSYFGHRSRNMIYDFRESGSSWCSPPSPSSHHPCYSFVTG